MSCERTMVDEARTSLQARLDEIVDLEARSELVIGTSDELEDLLSRIDIGDFSEPGRCACELCGIEHEHKLVDEAVDLASRTIDRLHRSIRTKRRGSSTLQLEQRRTGELYVLWH